MNDSNNILDLSMIDLAAALADKKVSSVEVVTECLDRINKTTELNNFITVCGDDALKEAALADKRRAEGDMSPLLGVPISVKDNFCTRGLRTTCGSEYFKDYIPDRDAAAVAALRTVGAVVIGKTNMDELAMGSTNRSSAFGCVKNALDTARIPGGSSGGSANSVCAKQVYGSIGSDTGGSVRQPAACCGVVGLKPTFGSVDSDGMLALAPSLDTAGVFARNVADVAMMFDGVCKVGRGVDVCGIKGDVRGKTVCIAREFLSDNTIDDGVREAFEKALTALRNAGAQIKTVEIPSFRSAIAVYHIISSSEAAKNIKALCALTGEKGINSEKLGAEVKRRLITGAFVSCPDNRADMLLKAIKVREVIGSEYAAVLNSCDCLLCPTTAQTAIRIDENTDPCKSHLSDMFAAPASLAGLPAVSVPFGKSNGLPVGVQIIGRRNDEAGILNIGKALEIGY